MDEHLLPLLHLRLMLLILEYYSEIDEITTAAIPADESDLYVLKKESLRAG